MGFSFSCFRSCSSSQRLAEQQEKKHDNRSACSGLSFMGLGCLWKQETKQMQLKLEDQKQQKEQLKKAKELTLEDWLINSPRILQKNNGVLGGEYHVFKHSSKRVFPSFVGEMANSFSKPRESFSKEKLLLKHEDVESEAMEVCLSRSQSRTSKKRVSFRLPEEADIFIFQASSEEELSGEKDICIL